MEILWISYYNIKYPFKDLKKMNILSVLGVLKCKELPFLF